MRVCIINFSSRHNGNCHDIAMVIKEAQLTRNKTVTLIELSDMVFSPCGSCNYECFTDKKDCPFIDDGIVKTYSTICSSDITYYIVPNYCDYPNSLFFMFNERSQCYFQDEPDLLNKYLSTQKKFVVVSNTGKENFSNAFRYHVGESDEVFILFLSTKDFHKVSIEGGLMECGKAKQTVIDFIFK